MVVGWNSFHPDGSSYSSPFTSVWDFLDKVDGFSTSFLACLGPHSVGSFFCGRGLLSGIKVPYSPYPGPFFLLSHLKDIPFCFHSQI